MAVRNRGVVYSSPTIGLNNQTIFFGSETTIYTQ